MTKYYTTILNHWENCLKRIKDIIMRLVHFELTHEEYLIILKKELFEYNSWKKLPIHDKEYIRGYSDALISDLYRFDLIWLHYTFDKKGEKVFYEVFESIPRGIPFYSAHFWKKGKNLFSGSDKTTILPERN